MKEKTFPAFTLLELIVAMAIIAVLIGLSLLGIQTVQRSSRDTERRNAVSALKNEIEDYYANHLTYPTTPKINAVSGGTVISITGGGNVNLQGSAVVDKTLTSAPFAGPSGTRYCYNVYNGTTYRLGVALESGSWFNIGNATNQCTNASSRL